MSSEQPNPAGPPPGFAPLTIATIVVCSVFPALATLAVATRFWVRIAFKIHLKADDWVMLPALALTIATCACGLWGAVAGHVGAHDWDETQSRAVVMLKVIYPYHASVLQYAD